MSALILRRHSDGSTGKPISGTLYFSPTGLFDDKCEYVCDTLEPPILPRYGCIPSGTYPLVFTYSPKFRLKLALVSDVPGRRGIRIHFGNSVADTRGCILVGTLFGSIIYPEKLVESRLALTRVNEVILKYGVDTIVVDYELPF